MANPITTPSDGEHDQNVVYFKWRWTVGASGALTGVNTKGVKSTVRNSAGNYTISVGTYPGGIFGYTAGIIGTYTTADGTVLVITADGSKSTAATLTLICYAVGTQTATDPKNGVDIFVNGAFKNGLV